MKPTYLYVHVPFCARRCSYCDFAVQATRSPPVGAWLDAIEAELGQVAQANGWTAPLELSTIYVGGGTPSLLGTGAMAELRRRLARHAVWDDDVLEWTAEANPESLDEALAVDWREAGVNRVSLGVQSFHEPALRWMGRLHGREGPATAVAAARLAGIANLSVDLIYGLPERLGRDWVADLDGALALEPSHVSLYGLTAESGTPLGRWVEAGRERLADDSAFAQEYLYAADRLGDAGFEHYEVSNFCLPGRASKHNQAYWKGEPYVGLGPGSHSFTPPVRWWNVRDWEAYREAISAGRAPEAGREQVVGDAERLERIWLGLRSRDGLPERALSMDQRRRAAGWVPKGLATVQAGRIRLSPAGWLVLDRLALELDAG